MAQKQKATVLLLGHGIREHVFAWKIKNSPSLGRLYAIPPNECTEFQEAGLDNYPRIARFIKDKEFDIVISGMNPLLEEESFGDLSSKIRMLGPKQDEIALASHRMSLMEFLTRSPIPVIPGHLFESFEAALEYAKEIKFPLVAKTDRTSVSKTWVCQNLEELEEFLTHAMKEEKYGASGSRVIVQKFFKGPVISLSLLVEGKNIMILPYCHRFEQSDCLSFFKGGYIHPLGLERKWTQSLDQGIVFPLMHLLNNMLPEYRGMIGMDIVMTPRGPYVADVKMEWDPLSTMMVLPQLKSDWLSLCFDVLEGNLENAEPSWKPQAAAGFLFHADDINVCNILRRLSSYQDETFFSFQGHSEWSGPLEMGFVVQCPELDGLYAAIESKWKDAQLPMDSFILQNIQTVTREMGHPIAASRHRSTRKSPPQP